MESTFLIVIRAISMQLKLQSIFYFITQNNNNNIVFFFTIIYIFQYIYKFNFVLLSALGETFDISLSACNRTNKQINKTDKKHREGKHRERKILLKLFPWEFEMLQLCVLKYWNCLA